jgi:hypothetical protein
MPLFGKNPGDSGASWEPQAADSRQSLMRPRTGPGIAG